MIENSAKPALSITGFLRACLSDEDAKKLDRFGEKLSSLALGQIAPRTSAQERFVSVANMYSSPRTDWEFLWLRFKQFEEMAQNPPKLLCALGSSEFQVELAEHILRNSRKDKTGSAIYLATTSAHRGNSEAFRLLGTIYEYGLGTPQDTSKAREYYKEAAELGASVEDYKTRLTDLGASIPLAGDGCSRKTIEHNESEYGTGVDDYDSSDWESIL